MKKSEVMKTILYGIGALGVISLSLAIPNLPVALAGAYKPLGKYSSKQIRRSFDYLKTKKLIGTSQKNGKTIILLSEAGKKRVIKFKLEDLAIKPLKKWDRKWRLILFDVPEKYKYSRQIFSRKLREIGFKPLQKSAWLCPYPCEDEVDFLTVVYEIHPFVRLLTFDSTQLERHWVEKFNL